jgi:peptide/nickel transport system substrate-binding protein
LAEVEKGDYHLVAFNDFSAEASVLNTFYRSDGRNNFARFADTNVDTLLTRATESSDPAERARLYADVQAILIERVLTVPIRDYVNLNGHGARVENLAFDAYGWWPLLANLRFVP